MNSLILFEAICGLVQCMFMSAIVVNLTTHKRYESDVKNYLIPFVCLGIAGSYNTIIAQLLPESALRSTTAIFTFLSFLVSIWVISKDSLKSRIKLFLLTAIVPSIAIELPLELYVIFVKPGGLSFSEAAENAVIRNYLRMMSMTICICYSTCLIIWHNRKKYKNTLMSILLLICIPLIQLVYLTIVFKPELSTRQMPAAVAGGIVLVFGALINLMFLRLMNVINKIYERENEQKLSAALNDMNKQYSEIVHEEADRATKIRHDIGNQIEQIEFLVNNGNGDDAGKMLKELKEKTEKLSSLEYCNNHIINTILTLKNHEAERKGIKLNIEVKNVGNLNIPSLDLSSSLSNMIDNALREASGKQDNSVIDINIENKTKKLIIRVDNPVSIDKELIGLESVRNNSESKNSFYHGHGLKILDDIAKRNNGEFLIEIKERICTAIITLSV